MRYSQVRGVAPNHMIHITLNVKVKVFPNKRAIGLAGNAYSQSGFSSWMVPAMTELEVVISSH